jgi:hypothetical protein
MARYEYVRDVGEYFILTENGIEASVLNGAGELIHVATARPVDAIAMAGMVVDLSLAGWKPREVDGSPTA